MVSEIDWSYLWQRHQIFATYFAQDGVEVFYLNRMGFRSPKIKDLSYVARRVVRGLRGSRKHQMTATLHERPTAVTIVDPLVLPASPKLFRLLNQNIFIPVLGRRLRGRGGSRTILYIYLPTWTTLQLIEYMEPCFVAYDCVQNFEEHPRAAGDVRETENLLLQRADLVIADSTFLTEKLRKRRPDVLRVPPGVDFEHFSTAYRGDESRRPLVVCYFGRIRSELDFALIAAPLKEGYKVRMIGSVDPYMTQRIPEQAQVTGPVEYGQLPKYLYDCDVILLPYKIDPFTQAIMPAKTYECFATGKPVVSTPLTDLVRYEGLVHIVKTPDALLNVLRHIPELESEERARARMKIAQENSWESRYEVLRQRLLE